MKRAIYLVLAAFFAMSGVHAQNIGLTTLVIDPGHGGNDPGAVSRDGKSYEKTFTLDIAKRLAVKINSACPGVKVVLTRDGDKTVALNDRAAIANRSDANLFMSIHVNSSPKTGPNGFSVHVLGQSSKKDRDLFAYNMDVCKRENSVILLEDDYSKKYQGYDPSDPESLIFMQLMQNSHLEQSLEFAGIVSESLNKGPITANRGIWQDPFLVLWKTAMPAVLVEVGFISNSTDLTVLKSASERDKIADALCKAFKKYKQSYDRSVALDDEPEPAVEPAPEATASEAPADKADVKTVEKEPEAAADTANDKAEVKAEAKEEVREKAPVVRYGVQIFAGAAKLDPKDKAFLGYTPEIVSSGKIYKYVIAVSEDLATVKKEFAKIREKYNDAFLVRLEDEKVYLAK